MIFNISRTELRSALDSIKSTVKPIKGSSADIAQQSACVKFDVRPQEISLTAYNMETGAITSVAAETMDSGEFLVNTEKLAAIVAKCPQETIECSVADNLMTISSGRSKTKISVLSAENYYSIPESDDDNNFTVSGDTLSEMINQTVFAASKSDNRPILQGEMFKIQNNVFELAAIDGYRLAIRDEPVATADSYNFVVHGETLRAIAKLAANAKEVRIMPSKKHVIFDFGIFKVFTRLLEGEFHNYSSNLSANMPSSAIIDTRSVIECLDRFSILLDVKSKAPLRCEFGDGRLDMHLKTINGEMDDSVDIDYAGDKITIGFNNAYLLDSLKACGTDKVKLQLNNGLTPMKIVPTDGNSFTYLVLPVRLKN